LENNFDMKIALARIERTRRIRIQLSVDARPPAAGHMATITVMKIFYTPLPLLQISGIRLLGKIRHENRAVQDELLPVKKVVKWYF